MQELRLRVIEDCHFLKLKVLCKVDFLLNYINFYHLPV